MAVSDQQTGVSARRAQVPNFKNGIPYPAVLLTTGMNDVHVVPWQMAKMAARLQVATASRKPVLLRVDWGGGHIGGDRALVPDIFSFLLWQMGVPEFQPRAKSAP